MQHPGEQGSAFLTLLSCPECGLPAEITDRFSLTSTDGPVDHVAVSCVDGHHFRMPSDRLSAAVHEQLPVRQSLPGQSVAARSLAEPCGSLGFARLPGHLGTVGNLPTDSTSEGADSRSSATRQ
jgi:hypothetical protein